MKVVKEVLVHRQFKGSLSVWLSHYLENTLRKLLFFSFLQIGTGKYMEQQQQQKESEWGGQRKNHVEKMSLPGFEKKWSMLIGGADRHRCPKHD